MTLRLRFNIILASCYLLGLVLSLIPFYQLSRQEAMEQLQGQIDVLRAQALAVRRYTSEEILPLLSDQSSVQFLPQTIPSFSAQTAFRSFKLYYPQFFYKEAALNPTNTADLADDWERERIEIMRANTGLDKVVGTRTVNGESTYTVAYPLVIKDPACLTCHSTPDKAPPSMVALYGSKNGFGWKLGETIGSQVISVPLSALARYAAVDGAKSIMMRPSMSPVKPICAATPLRWYVASAISTSPTLVRQRRLCPSTASAALMKG